MHDVHRMHVGQGASCLPHDREDWRTPVPCVQQVEERSAVDVLRQNAQRLPTDGHQRDDVRMPQTGEHANFRLELGTELLGDDWVKYLLDGNRCASPRAMVHTGEASLRYLTAVCDVLHTESGHVSRKNIGLLQALGEPLHLLLQAFDLPLASILVSRALSQHVPQHVPRRLLPRLSPGTLLLLQPDRTIRSSSLCKISRVGGAGSTF
mmetsp:Transcript_27019/g.71067  ORF Transcript_27019/g.71067 Transcript_27019/m.71067 type:complete len:208 (+) Transcript_27019:394-1017(+)